MLRRHLNTQVVLDPRRDTATWDQVTTEVRRRLRHRVLTPPLPVTLLTHSAMRRTKVAFTTSTPAARVTSSSLHNKRSPHDAHLPLSSKTRRGTRMGGVRLLTSPNRRCLRDNHHPPPSPRNASISHLTRTHLLQHLQLPVTCRSISRSRISKTP